MITSPEELKTVSNSIRQVLKSLSSLVGREVLSLFSSYEALTVDQAAEKAKVSDDLNVRRHTRYSIEGNASRLLLTKVLIKEPVGTFRAAYRRNEFYDDVDVFAKTVAYEGRYTEDDVYQLLSSTNSDIPVILLVNSSIHQYQKVVDWLRIYRTINPWDVAVGAQVLKIIEVEGGPKVGEDFGYSAPYGRYANYYYTLRIPAAVDLLSSAYAITRGEYISLNVSSER